MKKLVRKSLDYLQPILGLLLVLSILSLVIYASVQQVYRRGANEPQIQLAEDVAAALSHDVDLKEVTPRGAIDISQSLAPFQIIYDKSASVLSSSGLISGATPVLPKGIFEAVDRRGEQRFTWQPHSNVRIAAVMVPYSGKISGYVLSGRSLREVEKNEDWLGQMVLAGWGVGVLSLLIYPAVFKFLKSRL